MANCHWVGIVDQILAEDKTRPRKQRHTNKRIFDRLKEEHGFASGYTIAKDYVRQRKLNQCKMFVPLEHPPGHAQVDFGEAQVVIAGDVFIAGAVSQQRLLGAHRMGTPRSPDEGVRKSG